MSCKTFGSNFQDGFVVSRQIYTR